MTTPDQALKIQEELFTKALEIVKKKRVDYSGTEDAFGNFRKSEFWGIEPWRGAAIRLMDKLSRFNQLASTGDQQVLDESIEDTIIDAINYCVIMYSLYLEK